MVPKPPAQDLEAALRTMRWRVEEERFALLGFLEPPSAADLLAGGEGPLQVIREGGETTLLVPEAALDGLLAAHPEAAVERNLAWIRFEAPMGWEVVGFLALVTGRLADAGVPLGAVCGYSRDHLFLDAEHLTAAREVLGELFPPGADR